MVSFTLRRLGAGVVLLIAISILTYSILFFSSANIARNLLGDQATEEQIVLKEQQLGLDQPFLSRFADWFMSALSGDFGRSWFTSEPVAVAIANRLPITLTLVAVAILLTAIISTLIGMLAAVKRGWMDRAVQIGAVIGYAAPGFVIAVIFVTIFAVQLRLVPPVSTISPGAGAAAWFTSLLLPVIALAINAVASSAQQLRSAIIKQLERDYVRTLRSRGIAEREILFRHVLRSAAPAGLTILSLQFIGMLGGAVIVEQIFALPGIGSLAVTATSAGDIPVVMGVVLFTVIIVIVVNLLVDLVNGWLNPKVRVS